MNGLDAASRTPLSRAIPSRRIPVHDPSHMPSDYSTTPGGTIYSTTPGGKEQVSFHLFFSLCRHTLLFLYTNTAANARKSSLYCFGVNFIRNLLLFWSVEYFPNTNLLSLHGLS